MIEHTQKQPPLKSQRRWIWWLLVLVGVIALGTWAINVSKWAEWTNFNGKGLWELLELVLMPLGLAILAVWFNRTEKTQERFLAEKVKEEERDTQQDHTMREYIVRMSELLLKEELRNSDSADEVRAVANTHTHTTLRRLNPLRITAVLQFLLDARLIREEEPIIKLEGAYLLGVNLSKKNLQKIRLIQANLQDANFFDTNLEEANFTGANLQNADLKNASLLGAKLQGADLRGGDLRDADLRDADLRDADLRGADLRGANFKGAILTNAKFPHNFPLPITQDPVTQQN